MRKSMGEPSEALAVSLEISRFNAFGEIASINDRTGVVKYLGHLTFPDFETAARAWNNLQKKPLLCEELKGAKHTLPMVIEIPVTGQVMEKLGRYLRASDDAKMLEVKKYAQAKSVEQNSRSAGGYSRAISKKGATTDKLRLMLVEISRETAENHAVKIELNEGHFTLSSANKLSDYPKTCELMNGYFQLLAEAGYHVELDENYRFVGIPKKNSKDRARFTEEYSTLMELTSQGQAGYIEMLAQHLFQNKERSAARPGR